MATIEAQEAGGGRAGLWLAAGAVLCLVAAGGLMWALQGDAIFLSFVNAALAWCF